MAIRTFVFCDICNPMGIRMVEYRRGRHRDHRAGRRLSDGRSWIEGGETEARAAGWIRSGEGRHVCPLCQAARRED